MSTVVPQAVANPQSTAPKEVYVCAKCLTEQDLGVDDQHLVCQHCAHSTGKCGVFFKKRVVTTIYEAR